MDRDRGRDLGDELDMPDLGQGDRAPRVLLVDDDPVNLLLTAAALRDRGFSVSEAEGGLAALRQLADWLPDVIVLDAMMPGIDGFETCRELRELPGFELMPVLMLTGLEDEGSIEQAFEAGATDFFVKSHQWTLLAARLHYLLRSARVQMELLRSQARLRPCGCWGAAMPARCLRWRCFIWWCRRSAGRCWRACARRCARPA